MTPEELLKQALDDEFGVTSKALRKDIEEYLARLRPVTLRPCWYESNEMQVCVKCGQIHDKAIFPPKGTT